MSSDNFKDLTPKDNYVSVDLTGDSIVLPPDAEDVILVVEGDSSISGTVNVELEHSNDNVNFTTAKNKPLTTGAVSEPAAPIIEAYFSRKPNPRIATSRLSLMGSPQDQLSSIYLGELILNAIDASNPNGTYTLQIVGPDAQYVEFRATNENARTSFLDHFENESLDTSDAAFVNVQDPVSYDNKEQMSYESVFDQTSTQQFLAYTNGASSENKFNVSLKLRDSSHQMQQGHTITGINFKNKVELHTRAVENNYISSFNWVRTGPLNWITSSSFIGFDRGLNISLIITPEFGANPQPVTIYNPYVIRGLPNTGSSISALPYTASIGDAFGTVNFNITGFGGFGATLPALDYEVICHSSSIALSGSTVQNGGSLTATLNTSNFSPFGGASISTTISVKEPVTGLNTYDDYDYPITFVVQSNPLVVSNGAVTSPSNTAALGTDVCSVSVAGGLGTESITLTVAGVDASYYRLNNVTTGSTGSTITATSTDTVVLETNQAFSFSGYSHSVDIEASFTDAYGTYTDSVTGISTSQAGYTLTSSVSSIDEGNTFTVDLNTTGTTAGDTVAYTITGVDSADIDGASLTGNFTLSGNLDDAIAFTVTADATTEGSETFTLTLDNGEDSVSVTINDTSTTPSAPSGFSNEFFVSDAWRGVVTGSNLVGNYYRDSSSDNIGMFPDLDSTTGFRSSSNVSYSFWTKFTNSNRLCAFYQEHYVLSATNQSYVTFYIDGTYLNIFSTHDGYYRKRLCTAPNDNDWHHVVITTTSADVVSGATIYIDGVSISTSTGGDSESYITRNQPVDVLNFGGTLYNRTAANGTYTGSLTAGGTLNIDEFSTWKKTLTASEVSELWNSGSPTNLTQHSAATDLQRWFRFGDTSGDGTSIKDSLNTSVELISYDSTDNTQDASTESIYVAPPAAAFSNSSAVGTNVQNTGVDLGAYSGSMDIWDTGSTTPATFSVSFWAKTSSSSTDFVIPVRLDGEYNNYYRSIDYAIAVNALYLMGAGNYTIYKSTNIPNSGLSTNWNHYVIVYDTGINSNYRNCTIYINGIAGSTSSLGFGNWYPALGITTNKSIKVAGRKIDYTQFQNYAPSPPNTVGTGVSVNKEVYVDELSLWDTALTSTQITSIYNSGTPGDLSGESNLVRWFRFGDHASDTGTSIVDSQDTNDILTSSTDYSLTLTSSDSIYKP